MEKIKVEIVFDIVCPWCFIGKRRLDKAVEALKNELDFELSYIPFELNPQTPTEGHEQLSYLTDKFGGAARYHQIIEQVTKVAAEEGILFKYEIQNNSPNTFDLHRIIYYASTIGKQQEMVEILFKAYFENGINLSDHSNVIKLASTLGLDPEAVKAILSNGTFTNEVRTLQDRNRQLNIRGVPFYRINGKHTISGVQLVESFIKLFREIDKED